MMKSYAVSALAVILFFSSVGCQSKGSFGAKLFDACVSALLDTDDEEESSENRHAWLEATGGQWDGVTRDPD